MKKLLDSRVAIWLTLLAMGGSALVAVLNFGSWAGGVDKQLGRQQEIIAGQNQIQSRVAATEAAAAAISEKVQGLADQIDAQRIEVREDLREQREVLREILQKINTGR